MFGKETSNSFYSSHRRPFHQSYLLSNKSIIRSLLLHNHNFPMAGSKFHPKLSPLFLFPIPIFLSLSPTLTQEFVFNGFNSTDILLVSNATIESNILRLTTESFFSIGRAFYASKIHTRNPNSSHTNPFFTSFIFSMSHHKNISIPGHGIVFAFVPTEGIQGTTSAEYMGFLNRTNNGNKGNHVFGIEFDVIQNEEFRDISRNHVGINVNSLNSMYAHDAGYWVDNDDKEMFEMLEMNNGENYQVWIEYEDFSLNVTMAKAGMKKPKRPLLNVSLDLSEVFWDEMYVGFTSSTGMIVQSHRILAWSFSHMNSSLSDMLVTKGLPSFVPINESLFFHSKWFFGGVILILALGLSVCSYVYLMKRSRQRERERDGMEEWELEYWPHRITFREIEEVTEGFSERNVIGIGGNGKVYKGVLEGVEIAVKRISHENDGMREFLAEISTIGRLKHRNLVGLKGWCKKEKGTFMLAYDFMENGSLDKWIFASEGKLFSCEQRIRVLKDVAFGVLYLHEGWESKVLHRDIKASNVLLDKEMNARLGDFGLARVHKHGHVPRTTRLVGTIGYLAPEIIHNGRVSIQTDVFGFGVLILEAMSGRRPIEEGKPPLIDWVWQMKSMGQLANAIDERIRSHGGLCNEEEVERVLNLGLLCAYHDPTSRPNMRQVVRVLEGNFVVEASESEETDAYLLQRLNSKSTWSQYSTKLRYDTYPRFEDIKQSHSSSMSFYGSTSSSILDGR